MSSGSPQNRRLTRSTVGTLKQVATVSSALLATLLLALPAIRLESAASSAASNSTQVKDRLFRTSQVWTVHLHFTAEEWEKMQPLEGQGMPGPGPGWGPEKMFAGRFLTLGDKDHDTRLSSEEFLALGDHWFAAWDKSRAGKLDAASLGAGVMSLMPAPGEGPQGGGAPPPGPGLNRYPKARADLYFEKEFLPEIAVRYKGAFSFQQSRNSLKRSLKLDLNDAHKGRRLAGVTEINLHSGVIDPSMMNEVLSLKLYRDAGVPAPRTAYAKLFLTVPGKHQARYVGLYSVVENIDNNFAQEHFDTRKGVLFKPTTRQLFEDLGDRWETYASSYQPKTAVSAEEARRLLEFSKLVSKAGDEVFAAKLEQYLDIAAFARYLAVTTLLSTMDSLLALGHNFYVYLHPRTLQFHFLPWDFDHSFGQFTMIGTQEQRERLSLWRPWTGANRFLERVLQVPEFRRQYAAALETISSTLFLPERIQGQVDELAAALRPALEQESADKLAVFERVVAGNSYTPVGLGPMPSASGAARMGPPGLAPMPSASADLLGPPGMMMQPQSAKPIKAFVGPRAASVRAQLNGTEQGAEIRQREGPGGGPGEFFGRLWLAALDKDKDGRVTHDELRAAIAQWCSAWDTSQDGLLSQEELQQGIRGLLPKGPPGVPPGASSAAPAGLPSALPPGGPPPGSLRAPPGPH